MGLVQDQVNVHTFENMNVNLPRCMGILPDSYAHAKTRTASKEENSKKHTTRQYCPYRGRVMWSWPSVKW
jgi:hypothetical protein